MAKTNQKQGTDNLTKIIILVIIALLVVLFISQNPITEEKQMIKDTTTSTETIKENGDLDQAQDELNSINIDSLDSGLDDITRERTNF